ncbi:MAG: hypothetical protein ACQESP_05010 [Candidatus Muiribacteriota bacterium]
MTEKNYLNKKTENTLLLILFLLISVFFIFYGNINTGYFSDSYVNFRISENFRLFFSEKGSGVFNENPVYPFLINIFSFFTSNNYAALFVNFLAFFAGAFYFFKLIKYFTRNIYASFLATLFMITNPVTMFWALRIMPDILFMTLTIVFSYYLIIKKYNIAFIIFLISVFTRTEGVFLLLPFFILLFKENKKKSFIYTILFIILFYIKVFVLKSGGGVNFAIALANFSELDLINNFKNHLFSFEYVYSLPVLVICLGGLFFLIKLKKLQSSYYIIFYVFGVYFLMNVFWIYVQYRHWIPFIWISYVFAGVFFHYLIDEVKKIHKILLILIILFAFFTVYNVYETSLNRIIETRQALSDLPAVGEYISELEHDFVITNQEDILPFFNDEINYIFFEEFEEIIELIDKQESIYFILSDWKFVEYISWPNILEPVEVFSSEYIVSYPCLPSEGNANSWKWLHVKGDKMKVNTTVYKLNKVNFLKKFAQRAFDFENYELALFYVRKALDFSSDDTELLGVKKFILYHCALNAENRDRRENFISRAIEIPVKSGIEDELEKLNEK